VAVLGSKVQKFEGVYLTRGGNFDATLRLDGGAEYPENVVLELHFGPVTSPLIWAATMSGSDATWSKTPAEVEEAIPFEAQEARVWWVDTVTGRALHWLRGKVVVQ
jgi:hypothetical protein